MHDLGKVRCRWHRIEHAVAGKREALERQRGRIGMDAGLRYVYPRLTTMRMHEPGRVREQVREALAKKGPVLVDVWIDKAENVLPMVQPGQRLEDMIES